MHRSVMVWLDQVVHKEELAGKKVLEVGSFDVNGTSRTILEPYGPAEWVATDQRPGPNVDFVLPADRLWTLGEGRFDVVVSTEMLEHCEDWRSAVRNMKEVLKPGGLLICTARGPGMVYHPEEAHDGFEAYGDFWRFNLNDVERIFADMLIEHLDPDPEIPGFLLKAWKPERLEDIKVGRAR